MTRQASPLVGPLGRDSDVALWNDTRKLMVAAQRTTKVFRSRAAATVDTWTEGRAAHVNVGVRPGVVKQGEYVGGGGIQYLVPKRPGTIE